MNESSTCLHMDQGSRIHDCYVTSFSEPIGQGYTPPDKNIEPMGIEAMLKPPLEVTSGEC